MYLCSRKAARTGGASAIQGELDCIRLAPSLHPQNNKTFKRMGSIFIIQGILIYIYAFDHNPPHIHVRSGTDNFSITIQDRIIEGKARSKTVKIINDFIDEHEEELMELWGRAQRGEKITKIK